MSNVDDSSSNEYLDESQYLEEDDHYTQFLLPPMPPQRMQSKTTLQHFSGPGLTVPAITPSSYAASSPAAPGAGCNGPAADVIVEPEYSEADPGGGITGTYRSLPDGPASTPALHLSPGSSSSLRHRPKEPHTTGSLYSPVMEKPGVRRRVQILASPSPHSLVLFAAVQHGRLPPGDGGSRCRS